MSNLGTKPQGSSLPTTETPDPQKAVKMLDSFLKENNIELKFLPQQIRQVEGGAIMIEGPSVTAQFKPIIK